MNFKALSDFLKGIDKNTVPYYDCIVMQNHQELFRERSDFSEPGISLSDDSLYWIYSMTKVITVTAAMQLVERNLLDLDAPVSRYLPEYRKLTVKKGTQILPAAKAMTVRHLLSMQGGMDYDLWCEEIKKAHQAAGGMATTRQMIAALAEKPLLFEPGTHFQYSLCHDILAAVIEVAAGCSFGEYLKAHILDPLHMTDTGFFPTEAQRSRITLPYQFQEETRTVLPVGKENLYCLSGRYESGGAGLFSRPSDYVKLADALSCGGTSADGFQILSPETIALMASPQLGPDSQKDFDLLRKPGYSYGLGVRTMVDPAAGNSLSPVGEFGWDGAAGSYVMMDPVHHLTIVYFQHVHCCTPGARIHTTIRNLTYQCLMAE